MSQHEPEERERLAAKLEWWLAYFNYGGTRYEGPPHPDFVNDRAGFDESAIEADINAIARLLRTAPSAQLGERRIEGWVTAEILSGAERTFYVSTTAPHWPGDEPATLVIHAPTRPPRNVSP